MGEITRQQFAESVAAATSSLQHLHREVHRLIGELRDSLADELGVVRGTLAPSSRNPGFFVVRHEYGALFQPIVDAEDAEAETDDNEQDSEEGEEDAEEATIPKRKQAPVEIAQDQSFLALRIALSEPQGGDGFEPILQYAVLTDWGLEPHPKPGQQLILRRYMLKRIPRALGSRANAGARLVTRAKVKGGPGAGSLSCKVIAITSVPLFELDESAAVGRLATEIIKKWAHATGETPAEDSTVRQPR